MAEVSDSDIATGQRFLSGASNLSTVFYSGGRNSNRRALLQFSALGGWRSGEGALRIRVLLNSALLGSFFVRRWTDHSFIVMDVVQHDFDSNRLRTSGANTLEFRPVYAASNDYCWVGPAVVHFRQNA